MSTNRDLLSERLGQRNDIRLPPTSCLDRLDFSRSAYTTKKKVVSYNEYFANPKMNQKLQKDQCRVDLRKPINTKLVDKPVFSGTTRNMRNSDLINTRFEKLTPISNKNYNEYTNSSQNFDFKPIDTRQLHYDSR